MRFVSAICALVLTVSSAQAATIPIDLNDFYADPEVTVSVDGSSADFVEAGSDLTVGLYNDPFMGQPNVILPDVGTILTFDYDFQESAGGNDEFYAYLIDSATGSLLGSTFEFVANATGSGSVSFDLTSLVGTTLGLSLTLGALPGDSDLTSTLQISNMSLETGLTSVPLPASGLLLLGGLSGIVMMRRRRKSMT